MKLHAALELKRADDVAPLGHDDPAAPLRRNLVDRPLKDLRYVRRAIGTRGNPRVGRPTIRRVRPRTN